MSPVPQDGAALFGFDLDAELRERGIAATAHDVIQVHEERQHPGPALGLNPVVYRAAGAREIEGEGGGGARARRASPPTGENRNIAQV